MNRDTHYHVQSKLLTIGILQDYAPETPFEKLIQLVKPFLEHARRGIEQILLEVEFMLPYSEKKTTETLRNVFVYSNLTFRSPLLRNPWTIIFLLTSVALFY